MPTLDDFRRSPVQLAHRTILHKVDAHLEAGWLPGVDRCQRCDTPTSEEVEAVVACEQSRSETIGGTGVWAVLLVMVMVLFGLYIFVRSGPGETYYYGRDTSARVPMRLCEPCHRRLQSRGIPLLFGTLAGGVMLTVGVAVFAEWWAVIPAVFTFMATGVVMQVRRRRQRAERKALLAAVPLYAELGRAYRFAEVLLPPAG